jgi:hypothetical protein
MSTQQQSAGVGSSAEFGTVTNGASQRKEFTISDLERMAEKLLNLPPEPIGFWMTERGFPPDDWSVVIPDRMRAVLPDLLFWPDYVKFSALIDQPIFTPRRFIPKAPNTTISGA